MKRISPPRNASVLVLVLVCLSVAVSMMLTGVTAALRARRQMNQQLRMEQTCWLLDAGLRYAVDRCRRDPEFTGATRELDLKSSNDDRGSLEIKVTESEGENKKVFVTASITSQSEGQKPLVRSAQRIVSPNKIERRGK